MAAETMFNRLYRFEADTGEGRKPKMSSATAVVLSEDITFVERQLCKKTGSDWCVMLSDMESGIALSLRGMEIRQGDAVLCSGFAPAYVVRGIQRAGARPVLVDINPNTFNMDPYCLEYVIGKYIRTGRAVPRAVIATVQFGLPCKWPAISAICEKHGIVLLEDAGTAAGGELQGRPTGSFGRFSVMSLSLDSELPRSEEGAAVLCRSEEDALLIRLLMEEQSSGNCIDLTGNISVRAGLAKERLKNLTRSLEARRRVAAEYRSAFDRHFRMQQEPEEFRSSNSRFVIQLPEDTDKNRLICRLQNRDIPSTAFCGSSEEDDGLDWDRTMLLNTRNACNRLLAIPMGSHLTAHAAAGIAEQILEEILHGDRPSDPE